MSKYLNITFKNDMTDANLGEAALMKISIINKHAECQTHRHWPVDHQTEHNGLGKNTDKRAEEQFIKKGSNSKQKREKICLFFTRLC